jgi:HIP---CoA ligase
VRADLTWPSWAAAFTDLSKRFHEQPAILDGDLVLRWSDLSHLAEGVADGLIARGFEPGQRAAIWMPNGWAWIVCMLGTLLAGGVVVPINTRLRGLEARQLLDGTHARVLFLVDRFLGNDYGELLRQAGGTRAAAIPVSLNAAGGEALAELRRAGEAVGAAERVRRIAAQTSADACVLMHTSGTTGVPKGVAHTNGRLLRAFSFMGEVLGLTPDDRCMVVPPFSHTYGLGLGLLSSQLYGSAIVPVATFEAGAVLRDVERLGVTVLPGPPAMFASLLSHPDLASFDLSSLRAGTTGAAHIPVELIQQVNTRLGMRRLLSAYGLTESTGLVSMCHADDDAAHVASTSGRPVDGMQVRICDPSSGEKLPAESIGEIQVQGYAVMDGYVSPSPTNDVFTADGWLRTGDLGRLTSDGYVQIVDRLKDIVIVGGFNVAPAEVENVLVQHPAILEAAAVGKPDPRLGEVIHAFVVRHPEAPAVSAGELGAFCAERLAGFKVPRHFEFVDALPRNALGKVRKDLLKEEDFRIEFDMSVELGKVREFAQAIRATSPDYLEDPLAVIPPTFLTTHTFWVGEENLPMMRAGVDLRRTLHAEQEYVFHGPPPRVGDRLHCTSYLSDRYTKQGRRGGKLQFLVMTTEYRSPEGVLVATARTTAVQTEQAVQPA